MNPARTFDISLPSHEIPTEKSYPSFEIKKLGKEIVKVESHIKEKLVLSFTENMKYTTETSDLIIWNALLREEPSTKMELCIINEEEFALLARSSLFKRILIKSFHLTSSSLNEIIKEIAKRKPKYLIYLYTFEDSKTYQKFCELNVKFDNFTVGDHFFHDLESFEINIDQDLIYRAIFDSHSNSDVLNKIIY